MALVGHISLHHRAPRGNGGARATKRGNTLVDSLIDALATPIRGTVQGKSRMDVWLDTLTEERRTAVLAAVVNPAWQHVALLELLQANGAPEMADTSFRTWRMKKGLPRVS